MKRSITTTLWAICGYLFFLPNIAAAEYAAIAYDTQSNAWGWAREATQKKANTKALQLCNKGSKSESCELSSYSAIARAKGKDKIGISLSKIGLKKARQQAIEQCGLRECKVDFETIKPGFFAVATATKEDGTTFGKFFITYGYGDSDKADEEALALCSDGNSNNCKIFESSAIPGKIELLKKTSEVTNTNDCRPKTEVLRCSSQCSNGSCIVSYENGCKIRVNVRSQYDSFRNQWVYPAPSC